MLKKGMENIMPFTEMGVNHSQLTDSKDGNRNGKRLPFFKGTCEEKLNVISIYIPETILQY